MTTQNTNFGRNFEGGVYYDRDSAESAVNRLHDMGYDRNDVSVMSKEQDRARQFAEDTGTKAPEGTVTGGIIGGLVGAGIPEDRAKDYEEGLNNGGMLIGVNARDEHRTQLRDMFGPARGTARTERGDIGSTHSTADEYGGTSATSSASRSDV